MPVIAKILIDLDMVHRDVGVITLAAAVIDDTSGWIVLSVIAAMVSDGVSPRPPCCAR
jgi:Kef-type K+ transport system membrane component KefB